MTFTRSFLEIPLIFFYLHQLLSDFEEKLQEILRNFDEMKSSNNNNNNNNNSNKNKTKQNKTKNKKQKMENKIRACGMLVCQYVIIFCCNISLTDICQLTTQSINTFTCIKPSQILLKFGIKVAIYCTVLCFFLLFFLSV